MVYKDLKKPSANMLKSQYELNKMYQENMAAIYDRDIITEAEIQGRQYVRESEEYMTSMANMDREKRRTTFNRSKFAEATRKSLIAECLYKLYSESCATPKYRSDEVLVRNLINNFINEQGPSQLISKFKSGNIMLSEFGRICDKYYQRILEKCDECNKDSETKEFVVNSETKDEFFDELEDVDTDEASQLIKDRVSDAISNFVDDNVAAKMDYEEIIQNAQDKMQTTKNEAAIQEYGLMAKRKINEAKLHRSKNVFHCMVEALASNAFKDENLKAKYVNEAQLDMDKIVNDVQVMYTMLEMVNTCNIVSINGDKIKKYIDSLSA